MELARFAIIDPAAGISGDMLLGALVAAGAPPDWLTGLPARLGIPTVKVEIDRVMRCGVSCVQVHVRLADGSSEGPSEALGAGDHHHHSHDHHEHDAHGHGRPHSHDGHHHGNEDDHDHRHVGDLVALVERAALSPWVRGKAVEALQLLGEAEGRVHGMPWNEVQLHEVGAMDALVDIVGGIEGFERLGIRRVFSRPVALGNGWIRAAHGVMAVPAPATLNLLEGLAIGPDGPVIGEATTPTGAVLLRVLSAGAPPA
ncbi:MAG: nickel insertion protein, partial [Gemmatimonadales bacterium]